MSRLSDWAVHNVRMCVFSAVLHVYCDDVFLCVAFFSDDDDCIVCCACFFNVRSSLIIPTLVIHHTFTLSLQAQNLPFQQIIPTVDFFYLLDCLTIRGLILFLVSHFNFLFIPCGRLCWLPNNFLLHVKHYRIVSFTPAFKCIVFFSLFFTLL